MVLKFILAGAAIIVFLGAGGFDKLKELLKTSGISEEAQNFFRIQEAAAFSQEQIESNKRLQEIVDAMNRQKASEDSRGTITTQTQQQEEDLVSVLIGNETVRVPRKDVANISPANVQLKQQKQFVRDELARREKEGIQFTQEELDRISRFDVRKGNDPRKFSGVEAVILSKNEEEKAKATLIAGGATFATQKGQQKLFAKENFERGGLSQIEFEKRQAEEIARLNEVSSVTGLTRGESNALGAQRRMEQAKIEAQTKASGKFSESAAKAFLLQNKVNVGGGLTEKQFATIIQSVGLKNPFT